MSDSFDKELFYDLMEDSARIYHHNVSLIQQEMVHLYRAQFTKTFKGVLHDWRNLANVTCNMVYDETRTRLANFWVKLHHQTYQIIDAEKKIKDKRDWSIYSFVCDRGR